MRLLSADLLVKTSPLDKAEWNFHPLLGLIQRRRFRLAASLLAGLHVGRLLEIGYGSGVFMPELAQYCDELFGSDIHQNAGPVTQSLARAAVTARLVPADAVHLPFRDASIDCIVSVSSLEYVEDFDTACMEMKRVLRPDGCLVVITPGHSPVVDLGLRILTGTQAQNEYGARRHRMVPTLLRHFQLSQQATVPSFSDSLVCLYRGLRLRVNPR